MLIDTVVHGLVPAVLQPDYTGTKINKPHGGRLLNLIAEEPRRSEIIKKSAQLPTLTLTKRQLCDIELLLNGGFSPLDGFMNEETYDSVVENLRLDKRYDNLVWPMPITLDVSKSFADSLSIGSELILRDEFHNVIALMHIESRYTPNKIKEAENVFGTRDQSHPAVDYLMNTAGNIYLGGKLEGTRLPQHFDFQEIRRTPEEVGTPRYAACSSPQEVGCRSASISAKRAGTRLWHSKPAIPCTALTLN